MFFFEPVHSNLIQIAHHGFRKASEQFFQNLRRNTNLACILLHEFALISKFDWALLLQIRFESDNDHFCFISLIEFSRRKAQFLCKSPFYSDTRLLVPYESVQKLERKVFSRGKKLQNLIAGQVNQSINRGMQAMSKCELVDFHIC